MKYKILILSLVAITQLTFSFNANADFFKDLGRGIGIVTVVPEAIYQRKKKKEAEARARQAEAARQEEARKAGIRTQISNKEVEIKGFQNSIDALDKNITQIQQDLDYEQDQQAKLDQLKNSVDRLIENEEEVESVLQLLQKHLQQNRESQSVSEWIEVVKAWLGSSSNPDKVLVEDFLNDLGQVAIVKTDKDAQTLEFLQKSFAKSQFGQLSIFTEFISVYRVSTVERVSVFEGRIASAKAEIAALNKQIETKKSEIAQLRTQL